MCARGCSHLQYCKKKSIHWITCVFLFVEERLCNKALPEQRDLPGRFHRQILPMFVYSRIHCSLAVTVKTVGETLSRRMGELKQGCKLKLMWLSLDCCFCCFTFFYCCCCCCCFFFCCCCFFFLLLLFNGHMYVLDVSWC